jgi:ABC-type cobalamin/Fe3+-siderophores transport system ATPase subunit
MLESITLRAASSATASAVPLVLTPITVFVGPNNSGKSRLLGEVAQFCGSGATNASSLVLADASLSSLSTREIDQIIAAMTAPMTSSASLGAGNIMLQFRRNQFQVSEVDFRDCLSSPNSPPRNIGNACRWYLGYHTLTLDALTRMSLINEGPGGDLLAEGTTPIQVLFRKDSLRTNLRDKILQAFGLFFTIDPTNFQNLRIKLSESAPPSSMIERGWTQESVDFHSKSREIQQFSDGVKAFTGILMAVTAGDPQVILIDEPEAFLHPALAFKLGKNIADTTVGTKKRLLVATHSADFVMGCIQSGAPINIVRLTYRSNIASARVLASEKLLRLMRNPLLRSTGVLSALFYEFVVVSEAGTDRAFYQEVNERLTMVGRGVPNTLWLNAQNRQTVDQIIQPLRELGIPAAAIVDIDVVKEGGQVFTRLLDAASVPDITQQSLATARAHINNTFKVTGRDPVVSGGTGLLQGADLAAAKDFLEKLAEYGVFVVERGALESWLPQLGGSFYKDEWLPKVFELMGEDPASAGYIRPGYDDVWQFIDVVAGWLRNPNRKGIPA